MTREQLQDWLDQHRDRARRDTALAGIWFQVKQCLKSRSPESDTESLAYAERLVAGWKGK
jgi:hypothetical protein